MQSDQNSIRQTEARVSGKHCTSMHNAIEKLSRTPIDHVNGRKAVEESILHLYNVHNVMVTSKLKEMLIAAVPSSDLMDKLFNADESIEVVHPGVNNLAANTTVKGAFF